VRSRAKRFTVGSGAQEIPSRIDRGLGAVGAAGCQVTLSNPEDSAPDAQVIPTPVPLLFGRALTKGTLCPSKAGGGLPARGVVFASRDGAALPGRRLSR
jgi:hypothetical protein